MRLGPSHGRLRTSKRHPDHDLERGEQGSPRFFQGVSEKKTSGFEHQPGRQVARDAVLPQFLIKKQFGG